MSDDDTPSSPDTGAFTKAAVVATASGCTMLVTASVSLAFIYIRRNKNR